MKLKVTFFFFLSLFSVKAMLSPGPGDTIVVKTFSFGSSQDAWFVFPSDTVRLERILMKYTLKCNPSQSPACGQWDYLTNTTLHKRTGLLDSMMVNQPVFTVDGNSPDSIQYASSPTYKYRPAWQYYTVHTATTSLNTFTVGNGSAQDSFPFRTTIPASRTLYLWKASEMTAAGIVAGNITGLRFNIQSLGGPMHNMKIRMQQTLLDSLSQATLPNTGFSETYALNTQFSASGWADIQLTNPFSWNGTSNVIIEFLYDNSTASTSDNYVMATTTAYHSGLVHAGLDRMAAFLPGSYVSVPMNSQIGALDSAVTITFWAFGGPTQPVDASVFEAVDSVGNRILNCHLPWSDSKIYWDAGAGVNGQYDRISKLAVTNEIKGTWNHWALTKNVATGSMKIYLNGALWFSGIGETKLLNGIKTFNIGKTYNGNSYAGNMDEFAVFNKELSQSAIQAYLGKRIDNQHPNFASLIMYYSFNDGNFTTFADAAPGAHPNAILVNGVDNPLKGSDDLVSDFTQTTLRPNLVFEQGVFTSHTDSTLVVDSTRNAPLQIVLYNDSIINPGSVTGMYQAWAAGYQYSLTAQGTIYDSTLITPVNTLYQKHYNWFRKFPQIIDYELSRYITPYGIGLNLGNGFTWTFDLSDYRTLLADSVHLTAGNWQELLDVRFLMIEGIPPRDIVNIQNLWAGDFDYGQTASIETKLTPMTVSIPQGGFNSRWKSRVTGHGMDAPQNCSEFCPKNHYYKVNGTQQFSQLAWRNNCALNPLYPQGGTWVYERSNWCPGAEVWTYDFELTPFTAPGSTVTLDHDLDPYTSGGPWDYWEIHDQLVTYGAPNFQLDAAVEDILSPSIDQMWLRLNPVCTNPVIKIKNTGANTLTSLSISYGLNNAPPSVYNWTGNLPFMSIETVTLGNFTWMAGAANFVVSVSNPNGGADGYSYNNTKTSGFVYPQLMPSQFVIEFKTNSSPGDNQYTVKDASGAIYLSKSGLAANTDYLDTLLLPDGCYEFELTDLSEDGLSWWANPNQGVGYLKFRSATSSSVIKNFNPDFGGQVYQQFTVGLKNDVGIQNYFLAQNTTLNVYPNPSSATVNMDIDLPQKGEGSLEVMNVMGKKVYEASFKNQSAESFEMNVANYSKGVYFVILRSGNTTISRKLLVQ